MASVLTWYIPLIILYVSVKSSSSSKVHPLMEPECHAQGSIYELVSVINWDVYFPEIFFSSQEFEFPETRSSINGYLSSAHTDSKKKLRSTLPGYCTLVWRRVAIYLSRPRTVWASHLVKCLDKRVVHMSCQARHTQQHYTVFC